MKRGTSRHSKLLMLACELDIDTYAAVGLACCMWDWVGESMPKGDIGSAPDRIIAQIVGWRGEPSKLIDAMVKLKLLDRHPEHRLVVHDWSEHSEDGVHVYLARRRLFFADGRCPRTRTLPSIERKKADKFYAAFLPQTKCGTDVAKPQTCHISNADVSERSEAKRSDSVCIESVTPPAPLWGGGDTPPPEPEKKKKKPPKLIPDFSESFLAFWAAYPATGRTGKQEAWKRWQTDELDRENATKAVTEGLSRWCKCHRWTSNGGEFVCGAAVFLNQRRYLEQPPAAPARTENY